MTKKKEEEIPPTEDLMREHGILNRILLIYEEIIGRIDHQALPVLSLSKAITIIKDFIEDYHEKLEETYIFPLFEKHKQQVKLVRTLRKQHEKGRIITAQLVELLDQGTRLDRQAQKMIKSLLKKFVIMYRPHEAREDTELFPKVRALLSEQEFKALGELFENIEHERFGKDGFNAVLKEVELIEKELGIYQLEQFTPA